MNLGDDFGDELEALNSQYEATELPNAEVGDKFYYRGFISESQGLRSNRTRGNYRRRRRRLVETELVGFKADGKRMMSFKLFPWDVYCVRLGLESDAQGVEWLQGQVREFGSRPSEAGDTRRRQRKMRTGK